MISRQRDGTTVESYDGQSGIIRFLYGTRLGRLLLRPLIRPGFSKFMGLVLNSRISCSHCPGLYSQESYFHERLSRKALSLL